MNTPELRAACASQLQTNAAKVAALNAFVGFDGFVDEILHVVDKRENADKVSSPANHFQICGTPRRRCG